MCEAPDYYYSKSTKTTTTRAVGSDQGANYLYDRYIVSCVTDMSTGTY